MPLNCPLCYLDECRGCRHFTENKCYSSLPARSVSEILTIEERLELLEKSPPESEPIPKRLLDRLQQIEGKLLFFESKLNEHLDKKQGYAKYD